MNNGKRQIIRLLNRNVVAKVTLMRCVQFACCVAGAAVFALALRGLLRSELTGAQIVLWLLMCSAGPLVFIGAALVLPMVAEKEDTRVE